MKNGSPSVRLGEAWKGNTPQGVVAVVGLDQANTSNFHRFLGLSVGSNDEQCSNQMQIVLNLRVPIFEAGFVQRMVLNYISSLRREKQAKASMPSMNFSALRVNNRLKQGLWS